MHSILAGIHDDRSISWFRGLLDGVPTNAVPSSRGSTWEATGNEISTLPYAGATSLPIAAGARRTIVSQVSTVLAEQETIPTYADRPQNYCAAARSAAAPLIQQPVPQK